MILTLIICGIVAFICGVILFALEDWPIDDVEERR